jgi:hypothetical protein
LSLDARAKTIDIMTWNIRGDGRPFNIKDGRHGWEARKPLLKQRIEHHLPAIIGIQEGYEAQQKDLADYLTDYQLVFQNRGESGKEWHNSYYSSLLYKTSEVEIKESFDAWLSATPHCSRKSAAKKQVSTNGDWRKTNL